MDLIVIYCSVMEMNIFVIDGFVEILKKKIASLRN